MDYECRVCNARATGFHFDVQSCSACTAFFRNWQIESVCHMSSEPASQVLSNDINAVFFRRAISLKRNYKCVKEDYIASAASHSNEDILNKELCRIDYTEKKLCRACRLRKCFAVGMNKNSVQGPKDLHKKSRAYCTISGLKRNKRFSLTPNILKPTLDHDVQIKENILENVKNREKLNFSNNLFIKKAINKQNIISNKKNSETLINPFVLITQNIPHNRIIKNDEFSLHNSELSLKFKLYPNENNILKIFVDEEMRIAERRRIMFCERPVGNLLGTNKSCPFTIFDIKPLQFHDFRKSIRTHILLIYEWLRVWPHYNTLLCMEDQITLLRKCVLYHTILDPCFITLQMGDLTKFVLPNGGYVSTAPDSDDNGWQDEKEISSENKKKIYGPLLKRLMTEIIAPMIHLDLKFEEFVALKALISFQMTMPDVSVDGRRLMKLALDEVCRSLHSHYLKLESSEMDIAERFGNIILLLSPIFDTATNFVESHHQVQFFDLWQLDSLLLQFLKNKV